jgi:hypothetical protein
MQDNCSGQAKSNQICCASLFTYMIYFWFTWVNHFGDIHLMSSNRLSQHTMLPDNSQLQHCVRSSASLMRVKNRPRWWLWSVKDKCNEAVTYLSMDLLCRFCVLLTYRTTGNKQDTQANNPESEVTILLEYGGAMSLGEMCPKLWDCMVVTSVTIRRHSMHPPSDIKPVNYLRVLTASSL